MTDEGQEQNVPENESKDTPDPTPDVRYTDKDVDKLKGSARKEGRNSGRTEREQEILEATGAESLDSVLEAYNAWKVLEEESAGETEKERKAREKVEKERDEVKTELESAYAFIAEMKQEAALQKAFNDAGINPERLSAALRLVDMDALEVDDDGKVTGAEDAVKSIQKSVPELFGYDKPAGSRPSPRPRDSGALTQEQEKEAREAAAQQYQEMF
jgi:hypothetical protein